MLSPTALETFDKTVLLNTWLPQKPHKRQARFLLAPELEVLYGGAAGGGKSSALLMAAAQYVTEPGYAALLIRRTFPDLMQPDALIPRSKAWWMNTGAQWVPQERRWKFPSGATITFGYLERDDDVYQYQGAAYQFIGIDELTQHTEFRYRYLFSRLRRLADSAVPLRMRAGSNPGGVGHQWVKDRFIEPASQDAARAFIPARLDDNPSLDRSEYRASLTHLDPITRQQLLDGDWVSGEGAMFRRSWFEVVDAAPSDLKRVRAWDLAATDPKKTKDPDWTAGVLLGRTKDGLYYVLDVRRTRAAPGAVESLVRQTASEDGRGIEIVMEQEPGSAGVTVIDHYLRRVLHGYNFRGVKATGPKEVRAQPLASMAEAGNVKILRGTWNKDFLDELEVFPLGNHDDMVDAVSYAFERLTMPRSLHIFA